MVQFFAPFLKSPILHFFVVFVLLAFEGNIYSLKILFADISDICTQLTSDLLKSLRFAKFSTFAETIYSHIPIICPVKRYTIK